MANFYIEFVAKLLIVDTWPPRAVFGREKKAHNMLWTIAVIMLVLWLLGLVTSYTMGGFIHILLVIAVVMILVNFIRGRTV